MVNHCRERNQVFQGFRNNRVPRTSWCKFPPGGGTLWLGDREGFDAHCECANILERKPLSFSVAPAFLWRDVAILETQHMLHQHYLCLRCHGTLHPAKCTAPAELSVRNLSSLCCHQVRCHWAAASHSCTDCCHLILSFRSFKHLFNANKRQCRLLGEAIRVLVMSSVISIDSGEIEALCSQSSHGVTRSLCEMLIFCFVLGTGCRCQQESFGGVCCTFWENCVEPGQMSVCESECFCRIRDCSLYSPAAPWKLRHALLEGMALAFLSSDDIMWHVDVEAINDYHPPQLQGSPHITPNMFLKSSSSTFLKEVLSWPKSLFVFFRKMALVTLSCH